MELSLSSIAIGSVIGVGIGIVYLIITLFINNKK